MSDYTNDKNGTPTIQKRPGGRLDYSFDWTAWLAAVGDTITSYTVDVPQGLTKESVMLDGGVVTVWLKGGVAGYKFQVRCDIVTSSSPPREDSRTIMVDIRP
jgi:hypothetical protein